MMKAPVLVVDDAPYDRTLAPALSALDYHVVSARSGAEGLRQFEAMQSAWVVVGARVNDASALVDGIRRLDKEAQILVTTTG